jgi:hypothetical protein
MLAVLVKELDLYINPLLLKLVAEGASRAELPIYRTTIVDVTITNLRGRVQTHCVLFIITNLRRYKVYLSLL